MADRESYADDATMRDARAQYFERFHLDESTHVDPWVRLKAGPIPLAFPNTKDRVRAVRFHDLHHVLTGYRADWRGECEISSFELASGMGDFATGFAINVSGFAIGLVLCPVRSFRAWRRGRRSGNLYRCERVWRESLLDERVAAVRARVGVAADDAADVSSAADVASFTAYVGLALAPIVAVVVAGAVVLLRSVLP